MSIGNGIAGYVCEHFARCDEVRDEYSIVCEKLKMEEAIRRWPL